jgi:hypothetical protein
LEPPAATPPAADSSTTATQKQPQRPKRTPIAKPTGPFILDPLL